MTKRNNWTREELLIAMNLYLRLPFGQFHRGNKIIIEVARIINRTPDALAWKLNNLASLDPKHQERGVQGATHCSKLDREMWSEFQENCSSTILLSEKLFSEITKQINPLSLTPEQQNLIDLPDTKQIETEIVKEVKLRRGQSIFRKAVLSSYNYQCCVTGNPIPELLIASHILPWRDYPEHRLNPRNGLCLSRNYDVAFDRGLISFDENYQMILSKYLLDFTSSPIIQKDFFDYQSKALKLPHKFLPMQDFLDIHRQKIFKN